MATKAEREAERLTRLEERMAAHIDLVAKELARGGACFDANAEAHKRIEQQLADHRSEANQMQQRIINRIWWLVGLWFTALSGIISTAYYLISHHEVMLHLPPVQY